METNGMTEEQAIAARQKYVTAFNSTMIKIWTEKIKALDVIDTGKLLNSVMALPIRADGRLYEISLEQSFLEYGLWQEYGTGKEVARGNKGDIGRKKVRKKKPWFARKYFASAMNLKDFLADSVGEEFVGMISNAWSDSNMRYNH